MPKAAPEKVKHSILVVEDEKAMLRALELKLTHEGYAVTAVGDGEEAINKMKDQSFGLILMDLMMPKLDGFGVLTKMKEMNLKTPVIILSNLSQEEDKKKCEALGVKDFFIKSNTPLSEIVAKVKTSLA